MKLSVWHNVLWSRYKGVVWSALYRKALERGVALTIYQIAETEADRTVLSPVDLSCHNYPYKLEFQGSYSRVPKFRLYRRLVSDTLQDKADLTLLAGFSAPEYWLQALALRLTGRRFAVVCDSTLYDNPQSHIKGFAKRVFFSQASGVFCYGVRAKAYLMHYGVPPERIFHRNQTAALPLGYTRDNALQRRIREISPSPRFLYVGRLAPEKSLDILISAFSKTLKSLPEARLILVGNGPEERRLKKLAEGLSLGDAVVFAGARHDDALVSEYVQATAFVLPSKSEPWGLVVNEALSYGTPVIVSHRCGCVPELVADGVTGFSFEWGDVEDLSAKLLLATAAFKDVRATAEACLTHIAAYSPEAAAEALLDGCKKILARQ